MWELDHKEGWALKKWCFQTVVLKKTCESALDCEEIKLVNSKGNQPWIFLERTDAKAEAPILWPPATRSQLIEKDASVQFSSVAQLFPTPCDPMNCSTLGLPVHHQLPEPTQTHVHWVGDAIQPSHPLSSPSPPAFNLSQHQGLFKWVSSLHRVAKVLEFQLQHQSFLMMGNMKAKGENYGVVPTVCSTGLPLVLEGPGPETRQIYTKDRQKENTGIEESDVLNLSLKGSIAGSLEGMIHLRKS